MSMTTIVSQRCTWAGQALRLAADPAETLRAASLLLRGCPSPVSYTHLTLPTILRV